MKKVIVVVLFLFSITELNFAQQLNLPVNSEHQIRYSKQLYDTANNSFASIQPYIQSLISYDYTYVPPFRTSYNKFEKILTQKSLIELKHDSLYLTIDPLFNFESTTKNDVGEKYSRNTRGIWVRGSIGKNFSFESSFLENQISTPAYLNDFVKYYKVFPGMGRTKTFKKTGYDYAMASGYFSYSPIKKLNIQFGHGKLFIGNGYRSLLLSDNAFNFVHSKITYQYKKLQYTWAIASLIEIRNPQLFLFAEPLLRKKNASFQYLSYKPNKIFEIGLFQGIIYYNNSDKFNWSALNPVILSQSVQFGLANKNNVLIGTNFSLKATKSILLYAQYMCDDFSTNRLNFNNKTGYQLGTYYRNVAAINNLNLRLEYNSVRPFAYQHNVATQSYSHYNQSLAHPLNANFKELVFITDYNYSNLILRLKIISAKVGVDSLNFNAGNIIINSTNTNIKNANYSDVKTLRGNLKALLAQDFSIGYLINPTTNLCLRIGYFKRNFTGSNVNYFYINASAFIFNQYLDF